MIKIRRFFEVIADSTTKSGKDGKKEKVKKVEEEKQAKLALEVYYSGRKITFAKEIGVEDKDFKELIEKVRKDVTQK